MTKIVRNVPIKMNSADKNHTGRLADTNDANCKGYILCTKTVPNNNGETHLVSSLYNCPGEYVFAPELSRCVRSDR